MGIKGITLKSLVLVPVDQYLLSLLQLLIFLWYSTVGDTNLAGTVHKYCKESTEWHMCRSLLLCRARLPLYCSVEEGLGLWPTNRVWGANILFDLRSSLRQAITSNTTNQV